MALDKWSNTGLSTLASGIDASQLTATLATGTGSRFPADTFNVVIWNSTDFANPIDASDREIVRCTSRSGDVLTIVRGQEGTSGVAHNTGGKTYSVALIVSQKFRDDLQTGHEIDGNPKFKSGTSFSGEFDHANTAARTYKMPNYSGGIDVTDPHDRWVFLDDFLPFLDANDPVTPDASWLNAGGGNIQYIDSIGGVARIEFNNNIILSAGAGGVLKNPVSAAKNPIIKSRWTWRGGSGANPRIGIGDTNSAADPANGIYFRISAGAGNLIAVARAASTESTLDTGVAATAETFRKCTLEVRGGTTVVVFVDGVEKGTISSNVPSAALAPFATSGGASAADDIDVDYIYVSQER